MMKFIASSLILLSYVITLNTAAETSHTYTTKYDGIDVNEILSNDRLLTKYVDCLLDQGPCTADGSELKRNLPDAIKNDCKKCTDRQREGADQVMHYIIDHRPDDWIKLEKKYNSDGSYKMKYILNKETDENKSNTTNTRSEDSKNTSNEH